MSFANFGIGVGAFAKGLQGGMQLGRQIKDVRNERQIEDVRTEGLNAAREGYNKDVKANIEQTGMDDRVDFMGDVTTGYKVGDTTYGSEDAARPAAEKGVDSVMDRFMRDAAPRISEAYVGQGNIEKAEAWNNWVKDRRSQQAIGEWSKSYMAAKSGDWDGAAQGFGDYYTNYIDDGVDFMGHETVEDEQGNVTGFEFSLLDKESGEERTMNMSTSELVDLGAANNPQMLFELSMQRQTAADTARLENAQEIAADRRQFGNQAALEGIKQGGRLERDRYQSDLEARQNDREVNEKISMLEGAGYDRAFIDSMMPAILGIGEYKKQAPPEEVARMIHQERLKASGPYGGYGRMSPEEQRELVEQDMQMFYDIGDTYGSRNRDTGGGNSGRGSQPSPASSGLWYNPNTITR